jgi:hypothetical protein
VKNVALNVVAKVESESYLLLTVSYVFEFKCLIKEKAQKEKTLEINGYNLIYYLMNIDLN